jgi:hypothetical protein
MQKDVSEVAVKRAVEAAVMVCENLDYSYPYLH